MVAIAIPVFRGSLTKAQQATEQANARATYAEAVSNYLLQDNPGTTYTDSTKTYGGVDYTASTTDSGVHWTVTVSGSAIGTTSYPFP